jgi:hypothetical protein
VLRLTIPAGHGRPDLPSIRQTDRDVLVALDDVIGGHDDAATAGPDDSARRDLTSRVDRDDRLTCSLNGTRDFVREG